MKSFQTVKNRRAGLTLSEILIIITILAILVATAAPAIAGAIARARMLKAVNDCRQITIALLTFAADHDGELPNPLNADHIREATGINDRADAKSDATSTCAWQILLTTGIMPSEKIFTVAQDRDAHGQPLQVPDDDFSTPLKADNNGWAYTNGLSGNMAGDIPMVYTQFAKGDVEGIVWPPKGFRQQPGGGWNGKVVMAHLDGSTTAENLDENGSPVSLLDGGDLSDLTQFLEMDAIKKRGVQPLNP